MSTTCFSMSYYMFPHSLASLVLGLLVKRQSTKRQFAKLTNLFKY
jgi:hypothetical protein